MIFNRQVNRPVVKDPEPEPESASLGKREYQYH
jgi:hypothetical protein